MNLIGQVATDAINHKPTAFVALLTAISGGIATALEWLPAVVGTLSSLVCLAGAIALLYHTILNIKKIKLDLRDRELRNGVKTRRDDK